MKIFKSTTFTWRQLFLLKLSAVCFGIIIGVYFAEFFTKGWIVLVTILFIVPGIYITKIWWKQEPKPEAKPEILIK